MSKSEKETSVVKDHDLTEQIIENEVTAVALVGSESVDLESVMKRSENIAEAKPALTLTSQYLQLDKIGDTFRGVFFGFAELTVKDKQSDELRSLKGVRLIRDRQIYVHAGANLVRQFEQFNVPQGQAVEIEYVEKSGNVKVFSITLLQ